MGRHILRFKGQGAVPEADLARIRATPGVTVHHASPRMLLVDAAPEAVAPLAKALPDWIVTQEKTIPLPDPRPKIRSS